MGAQAVTASAIRRTGCLHFSRLTALVRPATAAIESGTPTPPSIDRPPYCSAQRVRFVRDSAARSRQEETRGSNGARLGLEAWLSSPAVPTPLTRVAVLFMFMFMFMFMFACMRVYVGGRHARARACACYGGVRPWSGPQTAEAGPNRSCQVEARWEAG